MVNREKMKQMSLKEWEELAERVDKECFLKEVETTTSPFEDTISLDEFYELGVSIINKMYGKE